MLKIKLTVKKECKHKYTTATTKQDEVGHLCTYTRCKKCRKILSKQRYYSDEEIVALLGIRRNKMNYQDGANSLKESYFEIGQDSQFLSIEQQKRLLKTNRKNV